MIYNAASGFRSGPAGTAGSREDMSTMPSRPLRATPVFLLLCWLTSAAFAQATPDSGTRTQITPDAATLEVARQLDEGRFADVVRQFDAELAGALPAAQLGGAWRGLVASAGRLVRTETPRSQQRDGFTVVTVPLQFEKSRLDLVVS